MSNIKNNVVHINNHEPTNKTFSFVEKIRFLDTCKNIASKYLKKQLQYMFDNVDDFLFDLADKAESNAQQTLYFDAMREIRLQKKFIENDFHKQFNKHYKNTLDSLDNDEEQDSNENNAFSESILDGLLLVEDDELEESLAISNMISKSHSLFRELLFALDQRYSYLLNVTGLEKEQNPLGPTNLCSAFKCAVKIIDADIKIKLIVYKLFDRYVVQHFDELYQEINKSLAQAGVLPNIKVKIQNNEPSAHSSAPAIENNTQTTSQEISLDGSGQFPTSQPSQGSGATGNADSTGRFSGGFFSTLQDLLSNQRTYSSTPDTPDAEARHQALADNSIASFQPHDILGVLSSMQTNSASAGQIRKTTKTDIINEIIKISGETEEKYISTPDTDAIDIVSMLFDFILDDNNIPDCMKAIIGRLQIPILKVAILDKSFFGKKSHPARQLLNELANAKIDWEDENNLENDPLFIKIRNIVAKIVKTFEDDITIFSELLEEYRNFKEKEKVNNEAVKEELLTAKIAVAKEIGERIIYKIPNSIRCFITEVWKDVLLLIYMRDKKESIGWLTAIQVMDDLIWSIQPKSSIDERNQLVKIIPNVLQGLQDGLTLINYDRIEKETLFQGLQRYHIASLKGEAEDDGKISYDTFYQTALSRKKPDTDTPILDEPIDLGLSLESKFLEMAKDIELGKWVEFNNQNGKRSKGKLVWKSEFMGEYTFVDRKYSIVADKTTQELAVDLSNGTAKIMIDIPLFDRALDAIITGLKKVRLKNKATV